MVAGTGALLAGAPGTSLVFRDMARDAGVEVVTYSGGPEKAHLLDSTGTGVVALDHDRDGWPDLYFVNAERFVRSGAEMRREAHRGVLYRNLGAQGGHPSGRVAFADVSRRAGVGDDGYGSGGCVGDIDADGEVDVYVTAFGPDRLYRNKGDGSFAEEAAARGVATPGWSIACAFLDADGDGDHDLFVTRYVTATWEEVLGARRTRRWRGQVWVMDGPRGLPESRNVYYRNDGAGRFREATVEAGLDAGNGGYSMGVQVLDFDRDGYPDLYVANDSTANRLYRNRGDGTFEEVGLASGVALSANGEAQGGMGVAAGDVDGDGWWELVVTNFAHDSYALYRNLGGELFVDYSLPSGVAAPTFAPLGWGVALFDADNDADLDLFFANGHIYPQVDQAASLRESYRQPNLLLRNDGGGRFVDASEALEEGESRSSRGAATLDFDRDGRLDLAISNQDSRPSLLRNETVGAGRWLEVDLRANGPWPALGARVEVTTVVPDGETRRQSRAVASGGSYASQPESVLHFGLAAASGADLDVRWPRGARRIVRGVPADRVVVVVEDR
ncbi:MAG TPA: CRTAC1 family protein [Thermoanaerobaculia bacterium]|nr:CRTAC1 family protein [Thermoanaerobaculia bacterium]